MKPVPNFIIAGFAKNGTTYLDNLLRKHPEICMPKRTTDYSFFDDDRLYKNGIDWYKSLFKDCDLTKIVGQTSADCLFNPGSIKRLKKHLPNVKIIVIIRNPVSSLYSLYWHQVKMGREYLNLEKALMAEPLRIEKSYYHFKMYSYLGRNRVFRMIKNLKNSFSEKNILILPFEFLKKNELEALNNIFKFLKTQPILNLSEIDINSIPTNSAKIPKYKFIVHLTFLLRKIGLSKYGQYLLEKTSETKRPPKISEKMKVKLSKELREDINFHSELLIKYGILSS